MPNYDPKTGIHYGVIHQGSVLQAWSDSSDSVYDDETHNMFGYSDSEPVGFEYSKEGYNAFQDSDSPNIMLTESPFYTLDRLCSPCYPNAGDLDSPSDNGVKTYCFGHDDWFDGPAPYPVYDVKTGKLVEIPDYLKS